MMAAEQSPGDVGIEITTCDRVLHGEIAIFDNPLKDTIYVYTPDIPEHVHMAGPWMGEQRIPRGLTLELTGVKPGKDKIENYYQQFLVLKGGRPSGESAYTQIRVPR